MCAKPHSYLWFHRGQLLEGVQDKVEGLAAEQMALVDHWVCCHANFFTGSTFSVAMACSMLKDMHMHRVGWYFGTLHTGDAIKLSLPPE